MRFHREGNAIILITVLALLSLAILVYSFVPILYPWIIIAEVIFLVLVLQFFRNPVRTIPKKDDNLIYAPADGKVVVIEEAQETEYFKDKRIQVSIFMSPLNVHVNRNPIGGTVQYAKYHAGKYLVAWHPKSSTENERTTSVIKNGKNEVLFRQIAGAVARRIINYLKEGQEVKQGEEMGFIKFGSRVDVFLPLDAKIEVALEEVVKGNKTVIARFK